MRIFIFIILFFTSPGLVIFGDHVGLQLALSHLLEDMDRVSLAGRGAAEHTLSIRQLSIAARRGARLPDPTRSLL